MAAATPPVPKMKSTAQEANKTIMKVESDEPVSLACVPIPLKYRSWRSQLCG